MEYWEVPLGVAGEEVETEARSADREEEGENEPAPTERVGVQEGELHLRERAGVVEEEAPPRERTEEDEEAAVVADAAGEDGRGSPISGEQTGMASTQGRERTGSGNKDAKTNNPHGPWGLDTARLESRKRAHYNDIHDTSCLPLPEDVPERTQNGSSPKARDTPGGANNEYSTRASRRRADMVYVEVVFHNEDLSLKQTGRKEARKLRANGENNRGSSRREQSPQRELKEEDDNQKTRKGINRGRSSDKPGWKKRLSRCRSEGALTDYKDDAPACSKGWTRTLSATSENYRLRAPEQTQRQQRNEAKKGPSRKIEVKRKGDSRPRGYLTISGTNIEFASVQAKNPNGEREATDGTEGHGSERKEMQRGEWKQERNSPTGRKRRKGNRYLACLEGKGGEWTSRPRTT